MEDALHISEFKTNRLSFSHFCSLNDVLDCFKHTNNFFLFLTFVKTFNNKLRSFKIISSSVGLSVTGNFY